jgi:hypothetical protein
MKKDFESILTENKKRYEFLFADYDPLRGINSPLERIPFQFTQGGQEFYFLPSILEIPEMEKINTKKIPVDEYCKKNRVNFQKLLETITVHRLDNDFEFFCAVCMKIKNKEGGDQIFLHLNPPQRKILASLEELRVKKQPIRICMVKSRQFGGSTMIQIYMAWIQLRRKTSWNSVIAAHLNQAALNIRGMYSTVIKNYQHVETTTYRPFEGAQNIRQIVERKCKITVGSMQSPESIRSEDVAMAHLSEVASWKKTEGKKPEDLIQSIVGSILSLPETIIALESTAKGIGNYFHTTYTAAKKRENAYTPVFIPWFIIPMYTMALDPGEDLQIIETFTEYEESLWKLGATLEGIKWYRFKLRELGGDTVSMRSEYPSTDIEAFQGTGARFFASDTIELQREFNMSPILVGDVFADAQTGPESLDNIEIKEHPNGNLKVWAFPELVDPETKRKYKNRYCVSVDIGGRSKEADDSVIKVFDRKELSNGGMLVPALKWAGKIDFDRLAWKVAQIGKLYGDALLVPEMNKQRESDSKFDEGSQFYTLVDEITDHYENIYCRTTPEQIREGLPRVYGFHTNSQTKPMVLNTLNKAMRDLIYVEYDSVACDQYDSFENKGDGKTGAVEGSHDDEVMCTAIGVWACIEHLEPCILVDPTQTKKVMKSTSLF